MRLRGDGEEACLDDPLGVNQAKTAGATFVGETVRDRLASGQVDQSGRARGLTRGVYSRLNDVAGRDGEVAESVAVVWVPLVPGSVGCLGALNQKLDTSLQDRRLALVAVDANPGTSTVLSMGVSALGLLDGRNGEGAGHSGDIGGLKDGAGPVAC